MSQMHADESNQNELERLLSEGVSLTEGNRRASSPIDISYPQADEDEEDDEMNREVPPGNGSDMQGALGLFAEAAQDMATAGVELGLGRHFACVDFCNQVAEKAAQAVSLLRFGRKSRYDHDLATLGAIVGAPKEIQDAMAQLSPFHPETFYADTPPEEADEVISAEQAASYVASTRSIMRWARNIVLHA